MSRDFMGDAVSNREQTRFKSLLARALQLDPDGRAALLAVECGDEPELRERLETFLRSADHLPPLLQTGAVPRVLGRPEADRELPPGTQLGPYRIESVLGEGGMGTVFLAEQSEPVRRKVALKILRSDLGSRSVIRRFEAERRALALMSHPGIAKVLDAGTTPSGRPYVVMEYVDGQPIAEYCDQRSLSVRKRLEIFVSVCRAIHHAHQKGVIHRDVKPSNILVKEEDGRPQPIVIDFGIAKAVQGSLSEGTAFTEVGQLIGTPEYMSPEQADLTGVDLDATTDVYSLGVVLFELLTGGLPHPSEELRKQSFDQILRTLRESDAPRPSSAIRRAGTGAGPVAARRSSTPKGLRRQLRGELDWIVGLALEKDPGRRYPSASELAADLERHLENEVVVASPPSTLYRLRKSYVRNRGLFLSAGAVFVITLLSAVALGVGLREQATERMRAEQANKFLMSVIGTTTSRGVLDEIARRMREEFAGDSSARVSLHTLLGTAYRNLDRFQEARDHLGAALMVQQAEGDSLGMAESMAHLGAVHAAEGSYAPAASFLEEALGIRSRVLGPVDTVTLETQVQLANVLVALGERDRAGTLFQTVAEAGHDTASADRYWISMSLLRLAQGHADSGEYDPAIAFFEQGVTLARELLGEKHQTVVDNELRWADVCKQSGDLDRAEAIYRSALPRMREIDPRGGLYAVYLVGLAEAVRDLGRMDEARGMMEEALEITRAHVGEKSTNLVWIRFVYGDLLLRMGNPGEAAAELQKAVELGEEPNPAFSSYVAMAWAECLATLGRLEEAEALLSPHLARALASDRLAPDQRVEALHRAARICALLGRPGEADAYRLRADLEANR